MPKNEDGEFELVVGNKQLLSIVFILMVLFGVVFSMGYFLGRANTGGEAAAASGTTAAAQGNRPEAMGAPVERSQPEADSSVRSKVATPDAGTGATQPVSTVPVASESAPAETAPVRPAPEPERTKAVAPPPPERPKPVAPPVKQAEPPQSESAEPAAGQTFLQVAAVKKAQAQLMVEVLKGKGFHALMAQVEGKDVYRTLVGPVKDAGDLARTKAALESAGLKPFVKKY